MIKTLKKAPAKVGERLRDCWWYGAGEPGYLADLVEHGDRCVQKTAFIRRSLVEEVMAENSQAYQLSFPVDRIEFCDVIIKHPPGWED